MKPSLISRLRDRAFIAVVTLTLGSTLLSACSGAPPEYAPREGYAAEASLEAAAADMTSMDRAAGSMAVGKTWNSTTQASLMPIPAILGAPSPAEMATPTTPVQPYLVKTVSVTLQVEDIHEESTAIQALVGELDGYLANLTEASNRMTGTEVHLTIRIPTGRLDEALTRLEDFGKVIARNLATDDVTLQYVDMDSRLRNLAKTEARLLAHLERSGEMDDILSVEKEIDRVRAEIETMQGRMNNLANQIAFATVKVALQSNPHVGPITSASTVSTSQVFTTALRNLLGLLRGLWYGFIWIAVWSPLWVPLALGARYLYRKQDKGTTTT